MDPNAAIEQISVLERDLAALYEGSDAPGFDYARADEKAADLKDEILERYRALDGWLSRGGFLPRAWQR